MSFPRLASNVILLLLIPLSIASQNPVASISTPEQIKQHFDNVPCSNKERIAAVKLLLEQSGAPPSDVTIDKYKNVENVLLIKKGESSEKIVVGAHFDKVSEGCGAVDNWTGVVALAHVYRTLKDSPLRKTLVFVGFGREEDGLVGSRAMTNGLSKDQIAEYCAMINIDSLGLAPPQVADNMSSKKLTQFTADLAKELNVPFTHARIERADSDSSSFVRKKIPAVTIHGMSNDFRKILHSRNDQAAKINPMSVHLVYRLVLAMIARLDQEPCDAYK